MAYGFGQTSASDLWLNLDLSVFDGQRLTLSGGTTTSPDTNGVNTSSYSIGISSNPLNRILSGFNYSYWGNIDHLVIRTFQGNTAYQSQNWALYFTPELRSIVVENPDSSFIRELHSPGLALTFNYTGFERWYFALAMQGYNYSGDISRLQEARFIRRFSLNTVSLASSLSKQSTSIYLAYYFSKFTLGGNYYRSQSAISAQISHITDLSATLEIFKTSITYMTGLQISESQQEASIFHNISLAYYW